MAERRAALEARHPVWLPHTTATLLDDVASAHPSRPLLLEDGTPITYAQMSSRSSRLAAGLAAIGVRAGDHVAVDLPNRPETVALRFALARVGAVTVSVNTQLRHQGQRELHPPYPPPPHGAAPPLTPQGAPFGP
ncbi:MAG: AMP-binding protein, partial [Pseudonocardia sp.]|nr:AMP-binding protein [Pseudonocardia sp.]